MARFCCGSGRGCGVDGLANNTGTLYLADHPLGLAAQDGRHLPRIFDHYALVNERMPKTRQRRSHTRCD